MNPPHEAGSGPCSRHEPAPTRRFVTLLLRFCIGSPPANIVVCIFSVAFVLLLLSSDDGISSKLRYSLRELGHGAIYHFRMQSNKKSSRELFLSQHPVFNHVLNAKSLKKLLADRRKLRGGVFKNSLVASCSENSDVLKTTLASWNRVEGVREIVIVDYESVQEGPKKSLEIADTIDRLGRVVHVTVVTRNSVPNVPGHWARARALNLGVSIASGQNILFVDCRTKLSPDILLENPLRNRTFSTGKSPLGYYENADEYEVMFISKAAIHAVKGFDERIHLAGYEYIELSRRLRKQLGFRRLSMPSHMIEAVRGNSAISSIFGKDISSFEAEDIVHRSRSIPGLARYLAMDAAQELPDWTGGTSDKKSSVSELENMKFSVLREQFESLRHSRSAIRFGISRDSDYRLWIYVSQRSKPKSMLENLSKQSLYRVLLSAHRKFLHDDFHVPYKLLAYVENFHIRVNPNNSEGISLREERYLVNAQSKLSNYAPLLFDIVWRKKKLLILNLEVNNAMELFVCMSWGIASAISDNRVLLVSGHLAGSPVGQVLDFDTISHVSHREYNLKISILRGIQIWSCEGGKSIKCWKGDTAIQNWDEYYLEREPSSMKLNSSQHVLFNIESSKIHDWRQAESRTLYQSRLLLQAFASISPSREVGEKLLSTSTGLLKNISSNVAIWVTNPVKNGTTTVRWFPENKLLREGHRPYIFVTGNSVGAIESMTQKFPELEKTTGPLDAIRMTADLWIALKCKKIIFDTLSSPRAWEGSDAAILEWRRVHAPEAPHFGVSHSRPSNGESLLGVHNMDFEAEPVLEDRTIQQRR